MIPFTHPTFTNPFNGFGDCKVSYLSSVSGLVAWTDYIPVQTVTASSSIEGRTEATGYQNVHPVGATGNVAWIDYIPVYEDATKTVPWSTDANGYIPVGMSEDGVLGFLSQAEFGVELTHTAVPTAAAVGTTATFTRATPKTVENNDGYLVTLLAGEIGFPGARRVRNLLTFTEDFSNAAWTKINGGAGSAPTVTSGFTAPDGTATAWRLQANAGGLTGADYSVLRQTISTAIPNNLHSIYIKSNTGSSQVVYFGSAETDDNITATTSWQRLSLLNTDSSALFDIGSYRPGGFGSSEQSIDVLIWHPQLEDVTAQTTQTAGEYVSVGVYDNFGTTNLFTGDVNDFNSSGWIRTGLTASGSTVTFGANTDQLRSYVSGSPVNSANPIAGNTYALQFVVSATAPINNVQFEIVDANDGVPSYSQNINVTTTPTKYTIVCVMTSAMSTNPQFWLNRLNLMTGAAGQTMTISNLRYVDVSYYHGSFVDGVKCFPTDLAGNALPTAYTYDAVSLNGVAGTYVSTPDSVAASITGDIDIRCEYSGDWTPSAVTVWGGKFLNSGQYSWRVYTDTSGTKWHFQYSIDGTAAPEVSVTATAPFADNVVGWWRVTRESVTGYVNFYTSPDGVAWTPLGTQQTGSAGALYNGTDPVQFGTSAFPLSGTIYRAQIYNGIDGTLAVDFDASRYAGGTTLTGSTGETWTLQGNAVIHPTNNPNLGYNAEGARENLALQSQTIATAPWQIGNGIAVTENQYVAPDGTTTVDKLTALAGNTQHFWYQQVTTTAAVHTYSVYLRYVNNQWARIGVFDGTGSFYAAFDILNGVVGSTLGPVTATNIEPVGDGVTWRVSLTATIAASALSQIYISVVNADDPSFGLWNAVGTETIGAWGAQLELGSFASSYIATTTAAVTRAADVDSVPTASNILAAASTVYLEFTPDHTPSGTIALWGTYVDASNYTAILHDATNMIMRKRIAGVNYDATIANAFTANTTYKVCGSWGASGVTVTLDGTEGTANANTTAAQIAATMQWGADGNSLQQPFATERNARVWQRQLSTSERGAITA